MLLRADAERDSARRIALCGLAAKTAVDAGLRRRAAARKALLGFDVLRARLGPPLESEVLAVGRELEELGELERAAEAYALAGDVESEVRALTATGDLEKLEARLGRADLAERAQRDAELTLRRLDDLDRSGERRAALQLAKVLSTGPEAERAADLERAIVARLARGPIVDLELDGARVRCALADELTVGRSQATVVVASQAVSRVHLRVRRSAEGPVVEDLDTRNGTLLAGARLTGPIPVGSGLRLSLGGEIPCRLSPAGDAPWAESGAVVVEVAGERYLAPLGEMRVGAWRLRCETVGDETFVVLRTPEGEARPLLGELELGATAELCAGDELRSVRGGPVRLRVLRQREAVG